jgi:hypothetical protein
LSVLTSGSAWAGQASVEGDALVYRAGPGGQESVEIELRPRSSPTRAVVTAESPGPHSAVSVASAGPGCAVLPSFGPYAVTEVECPLLGVTRLHVDLSGRSDDLHVDPGLRGTVFGGNGHDQIAAEGVLYGGAGSDRLRALGARGRVFGGTGRDSLVADGLLYGGGGDDFLGAGRSDVVASRRFFGGPGRDELVGGHGPDVFKPGAGQDSVALAGGLRPDLSRDRVLARDGESDDIECGAATRRDRLMLDGSDWASFGERTIRCPGLVRSSPALPVPLWIESPDYEDAEFGDSRTWVAVGCPLDAVAICQGTITVRVEGRRLGPKRFTLRPGRTREFPVAPDSYGNCDDFVPTSVIVRARQAERVVAVTRNLEIEVCPYDST